MRTRRFLMVVLGVAALAGACSGPPQALGGLWSSSRAACAAGLGVTFRSDAVRARFGAEDFVLLAAPNYLMRATPEGGVVRITYALATGSKDPASALGRGVIELQFSRADASLAPIRRRFVDLRTGAALVPLKPDAIDRALALTRCPKHPDSPADPA